MKRIIKEQVEYWRSVKFANYWHAEIIFIVPFGIYFIWRFEQMIHLLQIIAAK